MTSREEALVAVVVAMVMGEWIAESGLKARECGGLALNDSGASRGVFLPG